MRQQRLLDLLQNADASLSDSTLYVGATVSTYSADTACLVLSSEEAYELSGSDDADAIIVLNGASFRSLLTMACVEDIIVNATAQGYALTSYQALKAFQYYVDRDGFLDFNVSASAAEG